MTRDWIGEAQKHGGMTEAELAAERLEQAQQDASEAYRRVLATVRQELNKLKGEDRHG